VNFHYGRRLAFLRNQAEMTQIDVAKKLHISRSYLASLESGFSVLTNDWAQTLAEFYNVDPNYLIPHTPNPKIDLYLEEAFSILFSQYTNETLDTFENLIDVPKSLEQELGWYLLLAVERYTQNELKEVALIKKNFLCLYLDGNSTTNLSKTLQKYVLLFQYTEAMILRQHELCEHILDKFLLFDLNATELFFLSNKLHFHYYKQRKFTSAFEAGSNAMKSSKNLKEPIYRLLSLCMHATTHLYLKEFSKATVLNEDAIGIAKHNNLPHQLWGMLINRAFLYQKRKDFEKAIATYTDALNPDKIPIRNYHSVSLLLLQRLFGCYLLINDLENMETTLEQMKYHPCPEFEEHWFLAAEAFICLYQGDQKNHWKKQRKAIKFFKKSQAIEYVQQLEWIYGTIADYYHRHGKFKLSSDYLTKQSILREDFSL